MSCAKDRIYIGSGDNSVELTPHPVDTDPPGTCSRFYGQADWARGTHMRQGWMHGRATGERQQFEWKHGWEAGRMHRRMWEAIGGWGLGMHLTRVGRWTISDR